MTVQVNCFSQLKQKKKAIHPKNSNHINKITQFSLNSSFFSENLKQRCPSVQVNALVNNHYIPTKIFDERRRKLIKLEVEDEKSISNLYLQFKFYTFFNIYFLFLYLYFTKRGKQIKINTILVNSNLILNFLFTFENGSLICFRVVCWIGR